MTKRGMDKSAARLAMEIRDKTRLEAEAHLIKYGASETGATGAVAMLIGIRSTAVTMDMNIIELAIEINCP